MVYHTLIRYCQVTAKLELPRLSYRETSLRAAKDLEDAAALLPDNWDNVPVGQLTLGLNRQRVTSAVALGFKGKTLLYAASPMMNQEATGSNTYDQELCKQAADAFTRLLKMSSEPGGVAVPPDSSYCHGIPGVKTYLLSQIMGNIPVVLRFFLALPLMTPELQDGLWLICLSLHH